MLRRPYIGIRVSIRQCSAAAQRRRCVSLQWVVGRLSADKSMSHSLCLVRPNTPEADHSLPAYKLKQIALSVLYYLLCCWVLFQTSHWEVVLISQKLMTGASASFACFKLGMSNGHRHEFMGSAANEWSVIHCHSVFTMLLLQFQSNTFVYNRHTRRWTCVCHILKRLDKVWLTPIHGSYQMFCFSTRLFIWCFLQPGCDHWLSHSTYTPTSCVQSGPYTFSVVFLY